LTPTASIGEIRMPWTPRGDGKVKPAADNDKRHANGDDGHNRGLHQNVGKVERRYKSVSHKRCGKAQYNECDQWGLAGEIEAPQPGPRIFCRVLFHPPIAACSRCSS
jgi:hypothetical protein